MLDIQLTVRYGQQAPVLLDVAFTLGAGQTLGLVGQSGSGKSTLAWALLNLFHRGQATIAGHLRWRGQDLLGQSESSWRARRGCDIALVPQSPHLSLNPALRLGTQLSEAWRAHAKTNRQTEEAAIQDALRRVMLPAETSFRQLYPRQVSVGMAQRVLIAMATLHRPALLIADESTSALDVITQAEVLKLFAALTKEQGTALLFISHDLPAVSTVCQELAILHEGQIVERGATTELFRHATHPYTQRLIASLPPHPLQK